MASESFPYVSNGGFSRDAPGAALALFPFERFFLPNASDVTGAKSAASNVRTQLRITTSLGFNAHGAVLRRPGAQNLLGFRSIVFTKYLCYALPMMPLTFSWDQRKATANLSKHGISFDEAQSVFADEKALLINDPDHSVQEDRFILLGFSVKLRLLVVCHCYREPHDAIRIISARRATKNEANLYNQR